MEDLFDSTKISVVIPCHRLDGLDETLESVRSQTLKPYEIILVLNGGVSVDIDDVITVRSEDGISNALNKGVSIASGDVIARLDVGDIWLPCHLEYASKSLSMGCDFVHSDRVSILEGHVVDVPKTEFKVIDDSILKRDLLFFNRVCHPSTVWRKGLGIVYESEFDGCEDWRAWTKYLGDVKVGRIAAPTMVYKVSNPFEKALAREELEYRVMDDYRKAVGLSKQDVVMLRRKYY